MDGKKKVILAHDETSASDTGGGREGRRKDENMIGLDFLNLEEVVSIGRETRSQRVGALCRMSRLSMDKHKRDAI